MLVKTVVEWWKLYKLFAIGTIAVAPIEVVIAATVDADANADAADMRFIVSIKPKKRTLREMNRRILTRTIAQKKIIGLNVLFP